MSGTQFAICRWCKQKIIRGRCGCDVSGKPASGIKGDMAKTKPALKQTRVEVPKPAVRVVQAATSSDAKAVNPSEGCEWCFGPVEQPERGKRRKFCCPFCKQADYNNRKCPNPR